MRLSYFVCCFVFMVACGGGEGVDGGVTRDAGEGMDAGRSDAGSDAGDIDAGGDAGDSADAGGDAGDSADAATSDGGPPADAGDLADAGGLCDPMDVTEGRPCGPTERPGVRYVWNGRSCELAAWCRCVGDDCGEVYTDEAACLAVYASCRTTCTTDADCPSGSEWCESSACVPCDNSGLVCLIACSPRGWGTYMRNGCSPCECGPPAGCRADSECARGERCYAGEFCWCADGGQRPECCLGNICSSAGCADPPPTGCVTRGCARGESCAVGGAGTCTSSRCSCGDRGSWACTRDCGGGGCVSS